MKEVFIFLFSIIFSLNVQSQVPNIKMWDHRYGGAADEYPSSFIQTLDHGFLVCGFSLSSIGFDKTDSLRGIRDYWVVRTDSAGNILWDKTFGGSQDDEMSCEIALPDSGFLLGGSSYSGISGDKTQANCNPFIISSDYWIIRIDKNGNKLWDRTFGGFQNDGLGKMLLLPDGFFLLGGTTLSDSSVNMSHHNYGSFDYWIVKVDSNGNKIWDFNYGGTGQDVQYTMSMTSDHGFILGGCSKSPVGGCKSQPNINSANDYWIVRIDSNGVKMWDKTFGGDSEDYLYNILVLPSDKLLLFGETTSGIGFDKTVANHSNCCYDFWVISTDPSGNKLWDKVYGGNGDDDPVDMSLIDGGVIITGASSSNISGDKTEANIFNTYQPWAIAIDTLGNKLWDKTLQTAVNYLFSHGIQSNDHCMVFLSLTNIDGGDVTQVRNSAWDYWVVKFCPGSLLPSANYTSTTPELCQNSCIDFTNLSQNATSYQWLFPGGTPSTDTATDPHGICYFNSGTYDVTLIARNTSFTDTLTFPNYLTVYPQLQFSPLTQNGDTLFSAPGYSSYIWYEDSSVISGANDYYYVLTHNGNYGLIVTDSNGCSGASYIINVITPVEYYGPEFNEVTVNYSLEGLYLEINSSFTGPSNIELTDVYGKIIISKDVFVRSGRNVFEMPVLKISSGIYFIEVRNSKQKMRKRIFIH